MELVHAFTRQMKATLSSEWLVFHCFCRLLPYWEITQEQCTASKCPPQPPLHTHTLFTLTYHPSVTKSPAECTACLRIRLLVVCVCACVALYWNIDLKYSHESILHCLIKNMTCPTILPPFSPPHPLQPPPLPPLAHIQTGIEVLCSSGWMATLEAWHTFINAPNKPDVATLQCKQNPIKPSQGSWPKFRIIKRQSVYVRGRLPVRVFRARARLVNKHDLWAFLREALRLLPGRERPSASLGPPDNCLLI